MIPSRAVRLALAGVVALGAASLGGRVARAQQPAKPPTPAKRTPCSFSADRFSTDTVPGGAQVTFAAGSVVIRCPARGIVVRSPSPRGVAEEAPGAYKDVGAVVDAADAAGLSRKVAKLLPIVCVMG